MFFDKDEIDWNEACGLHEFYKTLLILRKKNAALKSTGLETSAMILSNTSGGTVLSFLRRYQRDEVLVMLNLSASSQPVIITGQTLAGSYKDVFDGGRPDFISGQPLLLSPWDYRVYIK